MLRKSLAVAAVVVMTLGAGASASAFASSESPPQAARNGPSVQDCKSIVAAAMNKQAKQRPARALCFTRTPPAGASVPKPGPQKAVMTTKPGSHTPTAIACFEGGWTISRTEACTSVNGYVMIWRELCSVLGCELVVVGWIAINATYSSETLPRRAHWNIEVQLIATAASGEGHNGVGVTGGFGCDGCLLESSDFQEQRLYVGGPPVKGEGWLVTHVDGSLLDVKAFGNGTVNLSFVPFGGGGIPGEHSQRIEPQVRCDTIASQTPGCVFYEWPVSYGVSSSRYPAVAYHVAQALGSGLYGFDRPLTRLQDQQREDRNREAACGRLSSKEGYDCDEYPFASTEEGAGATGEDYGRTFPDCFLDDDLPMGQTGWYGWSACLVPLSQNRGEGAVRGTWYISNRVIHGDPFYVHVD